MTTSTEPRERSTRQHASSPQSAPLLQGADVVCFANDWDGDPLSKKQLMRRLARTNRVLWVNSLGNRRARATVSDARRMGRKLSQFARNLSSGPEEVAPGLFVMTPIAIPAYGSPLVQTVNGRAIAWQVKLAMQRLGFSRPVVWTFVPSSAVAVEQLGARAIVYHCVDEYSAFGDAPSADIAALEEKLCRASDLVITCSEPLRVSRARWNRSTVLVRHGVDHQHFARALDQTVVVPADLASLPRPRIGFFGLIADWVDLGAVVRVAETYPQAQVILIGKIDDGLTVQRPALERLRALPNVHLLGRKPYEELPAYCRGFDLAILPFVQNELTHNANPLKLREYIAAGLPVISTDLPETRSLLQTGAVSLASSVDGFVEAVGRRLSRPVANGPSPARSRTVLDESWDARLAECCGHIERYV